MNCTNNTRILKVEHITNIAVVGAGLMGHGLAQEFALGGYQVSMYDLNGAVLHQALENIKSNLLRLTKFELITEKQAAQVLNNIQVSTVFKDVVSHADFVIEAVTEDLKVKQEIFRDLDNFCPEHTILGSNTSTLLPSKLAYATRRPDKVLVLHYINPPYLIPLVEIVPHDQASDETVNTVKDMLIKIGKQPVILQKEIPGFIANRLQVALLRESLSLVERGIVSPQDVDTIIKSSLGRRWAAAGIFAVLDFGGWDVLSAVATELLPEIESSTELSTLLKEKVERGDLGVKTGRGFYDYTPSSAEELRNYIQKVLAKLEQLSRES